jgi:CxxC-x17-CxxC domain-containing protein
MRKSTVVTGLMIILIGVVFLVIAPRSIRDFLAQALEASTDLYLALGLTMTIFGIIPTLVGIYAVETVCAECKQKTWVVSLKPDLNKPNYCQTCERKRHSQRGAR